MRDPMLSAALSLPLPLHRTGEMPSAVMVPVGKGAKPFLSVAFRLWNGDTEANADPLFGNQTLFLLPVLHILPFLSASLRLFLVRAGEWCWECADGKIASEAWPDEHYCTQAFVWASEGLESCAGRKKYTNLCCWC